MLRIVFVSECSEEEQSGSCRVIAMTRLGVLDCEPLQSYL